MTYPVMFLVTSILLMSIGIFRLRKDFSPDERIPKNTQFVENIGIYVMIAVFGGAVWPAVYVVGFVVFVSYGIARTVEYFVKKKSNVT